MKAIAIIPARGGSKRIPNKNSRDFLGKPIISYSIDIALKSNLFEEVMVSTDDGRIAEIAKKNGANVPFYRSEAMSNDFATLAEVLVEVVSEYQKLGKRFDVVCCILPTAPFIKLSRINESYKLLIEKNYYSVFPVLEYSYPIQRSLIKNVNGLVELAWPEYLNERSQDLRKHFHDVGQFYWIFTERLFSEKALFTSRSGVIELKQMEVQDIDTMDDWINAELKYKMLNA